MPKSATPPRASRSRSPVASPKAAAAAAPLETEASAPHTVAKGSMPSQTLYIRNLNEKIHKDRLRETLYFLFAPYGRILDIVTLKTIKMRGQAHIVFCSDQESASALKALDGAVLFTKPMVTQH